MEIETAVTHAKVVTVVLILGISLPGRAHPFAGGTGEPNDPYQIATAEQLCSIGSDPNLLNRHYVLLDDIDLDPSLPGGRVFTQAVIAPTSGGKAIFWGGVPFTGSLDGRGHEVRNLAIHAEGAGHLGLFGYLDEQAEVRDLGVANADAGDGNWFCGTLAGTNWGHIVACRANGTVGDRGMAGGLVGVNGGDINDSYAIGEVTAFESMGTGGLAGLNEGSISRCFAAARVTGKPLLAQDVNSVGGLLGYNIVSLPGQVHDSYFLIDTDGGGPDNGFGVPLTGVLMRQEASFANWDFANTWTICEGKDYPRLWWEPAPCGL